MWMKFALGVLVLVVTAVTFAVFVRPEQVQQPVSEAPAEADLRKMPAANQPAEAPAPAAAAPTTTQVPKQLVDHRDLDSSDAFRVDPQGNLVVNESVRFYIESLLAQGSEEEVYAVQQDLRAKLPPAAATQAMVLFDRFRAYEAEAQQLADSFDQPEGQDDALEDLESVKALRAQHFGQDASAMFAQEEAVNRAFVELMRIEQDESLTSEEKERRAASLRESIPELEDLERRNRAEAELAAESEDSG